MKCDKLLQEANKQYMDIIASLGALKRGEISGSKANADIMRAFDRVDESIKEYEKQQPDSSGFFSYLDNFTIQAYYSLNYIYKCIYMPCMVCVALWALWAFYAFTGANISLLQPLICALCSATTPGQDQQERHPEKCARIPSPEHGGRSGHPNRRSGIFGICAICRRSTTDQRIRSARARTGPRINRPRSADR